MKTVSYRSTANGCDDVAIAFHGNVASAGVAAADGGAIKIIPNITAYITSLPLLRGVLQARHARC